MSSSNDTHTEQSLTFWQHLEVLRWSIIRIIVAILLLSIVAFCFREWLFAIVMAPSKADFLTFRLLGKLFLGNNMLFSLSIINTSLAGQFMTHFKVAMVAGLLLSVPYILFELMRFVSPALYESEKRVTFAVVIWSYILFMLGVLVSYYVIFPFTVLFLGSYQVSAEVSNMIALDSYIGTMLVMLLLMGVLFELPIVSWLLARLGLIHYDWLRKYRKHAIVVIAILAAVITPSGDAFTMLVTALPLYLIFEISMLLVKHTDKQRSKHKTNE